MTTAALLVCAIWAWRPVYAPQPSIGQGIDLGYYDNNGLITPLPMFPDCGREAVKVLFDLDELGRDQDTYSVQAVMRSHLKILQDAVEFEKRREAIEVRRKAVLAACGDWRVPKP